MNIIRDCFVDDWIHEEADTMTMTERAAADLLTSSLVTCSSKTASKQNSCLSTYAVKSTYHIKTDMKSWMMAK